MSGKIQLKSIIFFLNHADRRHAIQTPDAAFLPQFIADARFKQYNIRQLLHKSTHTHIPRHGPTSILCCLHASRFVCLWFYEMRMLIHRPNHCVQFSVNLNENHLNGFTVFHFSLYLSIPFSLSPSATHILTQPTSFCPFPYADYMYVHKFHVQCSSRFQHTLTDSPPHLGLLFMEAFRPALAKITVFIVFLVTILVFCMLPTLVY